MLSVLLLPIFLYLSICVYKNTFVTPDGISVTFGETDIAVKGETLPSQRCGCRNTTNIVDIASQRRGRIYLF